MMAVGFVDWAEAGNVWNVVAMVLAESQAGEAVGIYDSCTLQVARRGSHHQATAAK